MTKPINQCDGCRANKPLNASGFHIMNETTGYPDLMSCTKDRYITKPQHQGSLLDQLKELVQLANQNGLYDAADYVQGRINGMGIDDAKCTLCDRPLDSDESWFSIDNKKEFCSYSCLNKAKANGL